MTSDDVPTFHTFPISLTAEQLEHLSDLAFVLHLTDVELVQVAAVTKIEEMYAGLRNIRSQLAEPDENDMEARLQYLGALAANDEALCTLNPEYKARLEKAQAEIERMREEQKNQYFF